ncbi:MAG: hypothetical protein RLZZ556_44 [Actinomycetota bacterium]
MNPSPTWQDLLSKLEAKTDLSKAEASWAMEAMMSGTSDPDIVGSFLLALKAKGESTDELTGFVDVMLANAVPIPVSQEAVDIVGTGGDQLGTVNISSMAAIVAAASGTPVLKHGSRSASGKTGSSEFLEALGIRLDLTPDKIAEIFNNLGIGFFFAPLFHPALKHVAPIRKQLGVPTTFNFLGPLVNPVQPKATALGVANPQILGKIADQMAVRNRTAIVFRGQDGLDELTTTTTSYVNLVKDGSLLSLAFDPEDIGLRKAQIIDLIGGDSAENSRIAKELFRGNLGEKHPIFQIVALNAAVAMAAFQLAEANSIQIFDFGTSISNSYKAAVNSLSSGAANDLVERWVEESNS